MGNASRIILLLAGPRAASVPLAFAAHGDTNLDGSVDVLDASNFLAGGRFDTGQAGPWSDGDFGYDGLVDILDAADFIATTLFDEGAYVPITAGSVTAVPEPALPFAGLAAILVPPLLRRIGRRLRLRAERGSVQAPRRKAWGALGLDSRRTPPHPGLTPSGVDVAIPMVRFPHRVRAGGGAGFLPAPCLPGRPRFAAGREP